MRKNKLVSGRIALDEKSVEAVLSMLENIRSRQSCVKINASQLVSWIVGNFYECHFERKKDAIIESFLNRREYLLEVVKKATNDGEVEQLLRDALKSTSAKSRRKSKKQKSADNLGASGTI